MSAVPLVTNLLTCNFSLCIVECCIRLYMYRIVRIL